MIYIHSVFGSVRINTWLPWQHRKKVSNEKSFLSKLFFFFVSEGSKFFQFFFIDLII